MPDFYRKRIYELIETLKMDPIPSALYYLAKMEGGESEYRIRIGDIRIVYKVYKEEETVEILKVEWRGRAYK